MFTAKTEAQGDLFMLDFQQQINGRRIVTDTMLQRVVMFGAVKLSASEVLPVKALLMRRDVSDPESEAVLKLVFGSGRLVHEGKLYWTERVGFHDGELSAGECHDMPDFRGYVHLVPTIDKVTPEPSLVAAVGCLGIEGRLVRNADRTVRISLTFSSQVIEDTDRLRAGVAI